MKKPSMKPGTAEIREQLYGPGEKPELDEVVAYKPEFFHLEQMDKGHWWMRIDLPDGKAVVVNLTSRGIIKAKAHRE